MDRPAHPPSSPHPPADNILPGTTGLGSALACLEEVLGRFDLGGSWIAPGHTRVRDLVARNGLNLVQSPPFETPAWRVAGTRGGGHKLPRRC